MFSSAENDPAILYQYFIQQVKKKYGISGKTCSVFMNIYHCFPPFLSNLCLSLNRDSIFS